MGVWRPNKCKVSKIKKIGVCTTLTTPSLNPTHLNLHLNSNFYPTGTLFATTCASPHCRDSLKGLLVFQARQIMSQGISPQTLAPLLYDPRIKHLPFDAPRCGKGQARLVLYPFLVGSYIVEQEEERGCESLGGAKCK